MGALVPTAVVVAQPTYNLQYGTPASKVGDGVKIIHVRATSTANTNTIAMASYGLTTNIFAIQETLTGAANGGTANTWSGTTITMAGYMSGTEVWDLIIFGN